LSEPFVANCCRTLEMHPIGSTRGSDKRFRQEVEDVRRAGNGSWPQCASILGMWELSKNRQSTLGTRHSELPEVSIFEFRLPIEAFMGPMRVRTWKVGTLHEPAAGQSSVVRCQSHVQKKREQAPSLRGFVVGSQAEFVNASTGKHALQALRDFVCRGGLWTTRSVWSLQLPGASKLV